MAMFDSFWRFIQGKLLGGKTYEVSSADLEEFVSNPKWKELALYEFALNVGINILGNALSACEVRTFEKWQEVRKNEYYKWNFQPNVNETANQFMKKIVWNLIYKNECLVIPAADGAGDLVVADSFTKRQTSIYNQVSFENISYAGAGGEVYTFRKNYLAKDVLYYNLSNTSISDLLRTLVAEYNELLNKAILKFSKSGGERGVLKIEGNAATISYGTKEDGTPRTFNDVYTDLINNQFKNYFKSDNAVLPMFKGFNYETRGQEASRKSTSEIKDVIDITDEIYEKVANALQISPALLKGDIADVGAITRNLISFGIKPIASVIETENNRKSYGPGVLKGNYQMIDTSGIMHMTVSELAVAADKMLGSGWTLDEIRRKTGDPILNTPESTKRFITLNYAEMSALDSNTPQGGLNKKSEEGGIKDGEQTT